MAKPRPDLPPAGDLRALADADGRLAVRGAPGASADAIVIADGKVQVRVRAPAVDGAANEAVLRLVAAALGIAPGRVSLLRGARGRDKLLQLD